ncbi:vesicular inhibitory amino acid transporter-like [Montipora foliosa]|uniref:vesicular inhibitory amino acid transporter-like n=1 Tax=Montipora foliosa TaxID=591990 RepID=UPI0035F0FFD3
MNSDDLSDEEREAILELQSSDAELSTDDELNFPIEDRSSHQSSTGNSSLWKSVANILNYMEGIGFLALPYAIKRGGIAILVAFLILPVCAWYTGKILIACLYDTDEKNRKVRSRSTFKELGEVLLPKYGGYVFTVFVNLGLFFSSVSYLVLCGSLMSHSLPSVPLTMTAWICLAGVVVFPTTFFSSLKEIGWLSIISVVALISVVITVLWYGMSHMEKWNLESILFWNGEGVSIALPILILAYGSLYILPTVEHSMREKHKFNLALALAYIINVFIKIGFSFLAFLSFGSNTDQVILNNLPEGPIRTCTSFLFTAICVLSYALTVFPVFVFIQTSEAYQQAFSKFPRIGLFLSRTTVVILTVLVAIIFPKFAFVVSFTGSVIDSMGSFVAPCAVHLKLKFNQLKRYEVFLDVLVIIIGITCAVFGGIFSSQALVAG